MIEKRYGYTLSQDKIIERVVDDENLNLNHMVLTRGTGLPEHYSNSNVYMVIIRGRMSIRLDDRDVHEYGAGDILYIPYKTKMNVTNEQDAVLEFFVVKAPNPKNYKGE